MALFDTMLTSQQIFPHVAGETSQQALDYMVNALADQGVFDKPQRALELLLEREALMTTAIKPGIALPHVFNEMFPRSVLAVGLAPQGVDFKALDGQPVRTIFLMLGPPSAHKMHVKVLARISSLVGQPGFMAQLSQASDPQVLYELLIQEGDHLRLAQSGSSLS